MIKPNSKPVLCMFLPSQFVWREEIQFNFILKMHNLRKAALQDGSHSFQKAKRLYTKDKETYKGKKNLVHGLRYLNYSLQLFNFGKIYDFKVENDTFYEVMQNTETDWNVYENKYRIIYQEAFHKIEQLELPDDFQFSAKEDGYELIQFFQNEPSQKGGIEKLQRYRTRFQIILFKFFFFKMIFFHIWLFFQIVLFIFGPFFN